MYKEVDLLESLINSARSRLGSRTAFNAESQYGITNDFFTIFMPTSAAETQMVAARVAAINSYAQPTNIAELLDRSRECLSELRGIVTNQDKVSSTDKLALDDLDKAGDYIKRAANNGPGGGGPPDDPDDPWWKKFFKTLKAFCEELTNLAASIAKKVYQVSKGPIATAWSAFWTGAAPTIITLIICALGGPCDPGAFGG
jgi:hypothetical protein